MSKATRNGIRHRDLGFIALLELPPPGKDINQVKGRIEVSTLVQANDAFD